MNLCKQQKYLSVIFLSCAFSLSFLSTQVSASTAAEEFFGCAPEDINLSNAKKLPEKILQFIKENSNIETINNPAATSQLFPSVLALGESPGFLANFLQQNQVRTTCYETTHKRPRRNHKEKGIGIPNPSPDEKGFPIVDGIMDSVHGTFKPIKPQKPSSSKLCKTFFPSHKHRTLPQLPQFDWTITLGKCLTTFNTIINSAGIGALYVTKKGNILDGNYSMVKSKFENAGFKEESFKEKIICTDRKHPLDCPYVVVFRRIKK